MVSALKTHASQSRTTLITTLQFGAITSGQVYLYSLKSHVYISELLRCVKNSLSGKSFIRQGDREKAEVQQRADRHVIGVVCAEWHDITIKGCMKLTN